MIDKIKQIKESRLKPEEKWFLDIITDLENVKSDKHPNSVFWKKDDIILFEQDFNIMRLWVNYKKIWSIFKNKYNYKYDDIQLFIKNKVEEHLNWVGFTPRSDILNQLLEIEEYLKNDK